ncbi:hypothetical protein C451_01293 [Halococcus thailandensis JCM 13552]|uniref:Uncharacterized protein n=1 Tax=Halococcus thailandensis JCM 13552 TaxID=1227457 RepID=M0NF75_9EURY|nr:hypothetical protein C451_01293 [Halococcus thailandensis JCM 13552]
MVDLLLVVFFEFVLELKPVRFVLAGSHVQQVALEASQIIHILGMVIQRLKHTETRKLCCPV